MFTITSSLDVYQPLTNVTRTMLFADLKHSNNSIVTSNFYLLKITYSIFHWLYLIRLVDGEIVSLLRQRLKECIIYEQPDHKLKCKKLQEDFEQASENYFIKCK